MEFWPYGILAMAFFSYNACRFLLPPTPAPLPLQHKGHQALAIAAAHLGGYPWLVSFSGMAEVLGWPRRLPLVAPCDRERVLRSWAASCRGQAPRECAIPFAEVTYIC
jgi:hypothetical protein